MGKVLEFVWVRWSICVDFVWGRCVNFVCAKVLEFVWGRCVNFVCAKVLNLCGCGRRAVVWAAWTQKLGGCGVASALGSAVCSWPRLRGF